MLIFELWANSGDKVTENHHSTVKAILPKAHAIRSIGEIQFVGDFDHFAQQCFAQRHRSFLCSS